MISVGNIQFDNIALGPMAGVTDMPFRLLCREMGAGLIYTEMVSAKALTYHNQNTESLLIVDEDERPVALQLFGSEPEVIAEAIKLIDSRNFDILDINMGCPVPKVVNNGEGSALMKNPELIEKIVKAASDATAKPVSVKIRKGFRKDDSTAVECALAAEQGGAKLIAVHGRTREDYYSGVADWDIIARVKESVKIPVLANGDITGPKSAADCLRHTKADGIMIARAAQGNPWIFKRVKAYLENGVLLEEPGINERIDMALRHAKMECEFKGEYTGIREMRTHVSHYMSGFKGASVLRNKVNYVESYAALENLLKDYREQI